MRLLIAGGTGFIGAALCRSLLADRHELFLLTRRPGGDAGGPRLLSWQTDEWRRALAEADGVINLAGESIAEAHWSPARKAAIRASRIETTRALVGAIGGHGRRPAVLINASAVGYYGPRGDEPIGEDDPGGSGFLSELCRDWEAEAQRAEPLGVRVVRLRIGVVLAAGGGALAKMVPPFRWCIGGPLGGGRQWMSWVHRDDVIGLIHWALARPDVSGALNATAPNPVTMRTFCSELGRALGRPSWAPVPGAALRLLLGEMADMLLTGQRALPEAALRAGYSFRHPTLRDALTACVPAR